MKVVEVKAIYIDKTYKYFKRLRIYNYFLDYEDKWMTYKIEDEMFLENSAIGYFTCNEAQFNQWFVALTEK